MRGEKKRKLKRREFLYRGSACCLVGLSSLATCGSPSPSNASGKTKVTPGTKAPKSARVALNARVARRDDPQVFNQHGHDPGRVKALVDNAVAELVGVKQTSEAYRALFNPRDIVAIKLNCLAGPGLSSSVSVVDAIVAGLRSIGIDFQNIYIWERTSAELARAGFELNHYEDSRPRCLGNDGAGFEPEISFSGDVGSLFTNILARKATALINVPVLKDHDLSGLGCGMKNMFGAIHNPNRYHDNNCDPFVADVSNHPYIKDKLRLVVADALTAQYNGGPARVPHYQWKPATILAANDPVALDRVAQKMIEAKRAEKGLATLKEAKRPPKWLQTAAAKGLGEADLKKIKIV